MQKINTRNIILAIIFILILIVIALFIGKFTYSYLAPDVSEDLTNEGVTTATGDTLIFSKGNTLSLSATTDNFNSTSGNLSDTTNPSVKLIASSRTNEASATYYAGIRINTNTYQYTTADETPEIILTVKDENGVTITTSSDELTYVTVNGVSGFDITEKSGVFNIVSEHPINTNSSTTGTTHTWTFTITFVNLETDQSLNENGNLEIEVVLLRDKILTAMANACIGQNLASCLASNYALDDSLYLHDSTLENSANDGSYRYSGGDYRLTSTATNAGYSRLVTADSSETDGIIDFYCNGTKQYVGYSCSTSYTYYYTVVGSGSYTTYQSALDAGVEQGYLTGDNVKNFVCFGSSESTCPSDNLYRIIGVFNDQVKLIKYDYATSALLGTDGDYYGTSTSHYSGMRDITTTRYWYYWNNANYDAAYNATGYYNVWSYSALNTVNLNTNYINNIGSDWASKIATTTWKVGGNSWSNIGTQTAATAYQNEIVNPNTDVETEYSAKIGLMYVSDYMYGASPEGWTYKGYDSATIDYRAIKGSNWMYMGDYEWTISRPSDHAGSAFYVSNAGSVSSSSVGSGRGARPSFSLESIVELTGGTGSKDDPYRIN